jgi:hypothetical protein
MGPSLGDVDAVDAQLVRARGEPQDDVRAGFERGETEADHRAIL